MKETELVAALNDHDGLIIKCIREEIKFDDFDKSYNSFYHHWALDGHESNFKEQQLLAKYANRIEIHRRVWDEILIYVCSDANAHLDEYRDAGRFGHMEAVRRMQKIAQETDLHDNGPAC